MENYLDLHPGVITRAQLHPLGWRCGSDGWRPTPFAVKFIGYYESLDSDLALALGAAGETFDPDLFKAVAKQRVGAQGPLRDACHLRPILRGRILDAEPTFRGRFQYH